MSLPLLTLEAPPELFTCGQQTISWIYTGSDTTLQMSLAITDIGVEQLPPLSSSSVSPGSTTTSSPASLSTPTSAPTSDPDTVLIPPPTTTAILNGQPPRFLHRRQTGFNGAYLPQISQTLVTGLSLGDVHSWTWPKVNVTQGWYQFVASVPPSFQFPSQSFFVQNGSAVDCLSSSSAPSSPPTGSIITPTPTPSSGSAADSNPGSSKKSTVNTGAVVGGVVGAFVVVSLVGFLLFICLRRRRARHARSAAVSAVPSKRARAHRATESVQALPRAAHASYASMGGLSPSDEGYSGSGTTTAEYSNVPVSAIVQHPKRAKRGSDSSLVGPSSAATPYTTHSMRARSHSQPGVSRQDSTTSSGSHGHSSRRAVVPAPLEIPRPYVAGELSAHTPAGATTGKRKPVPKYEGADGSFSSGGVGASRATLPDADGTSGSPSQAHLHHQGSFSNMRPMHVMMPDMPSPTLNH